MIFRPALTRESMTQEASDHGRLLSRVSRCVRAGPGSVALGSTRTGAFESHYALLPIGNSADGGKISITSTFGVTFGPFAGGTIDLSSNVTRSSSGGGALGSPPPQEIVSVR